MIDQVYPHVVGDRGVLRDQHFQRASEQGLSAEQATERFAGVHSRARIAHALRLIVFAQ